MGESKKRTLRLNLDRKLKLEFHRVAVFALAFVVSGGVFSQAEGTVSLVTPYANSSDIREVSPFSADDSGPYGSHSGIDFAPEVSLAQFQAACPGTVSDITTLQNGSTANWEVSVSIWCNATYSLLYVFEPMTQDDADKDSQLSNILVLQGHGVSQGEIIGNLFFPPVKAPMCTSGCSRPGCPKVFAPNRFSLPRQTIQ